MQKKQKKKEVLSATSELLMSMEQKSIKTDLRIKKVLACKPILAVIFAEVVEECEGMSYEEIESCIEGDVVVEEDFIMPTEVITGNTQEDYKPGEGLIRYDIKTYLLLPASKNEKKSVAVKLIIDVEAQKNDNPGYDIVTRGIFYCCRMISAQLDSEFYNNANDKKQYANLKKVYSIWICTEVSEKKKNTIEKYSIKKEMLYGKSVSDDDYYDLMTVIKVNIGKVHSGEEIDNALLATMNVITDVHFSADEKIKKLKALNVKMTNEVEQEVSDMTSYLANIIEESEAKGKTIGLAEGKTIGLAEGEAKILQLISKLYEQNRANEVLKATTDASYREKLYKEFDI